MDIFAHRIILRRKRRGIEHPKGLKKEQYNFLITNYQEINAHIRATDDKRDKILSIYILFTTTLIGVLLGFFNNQDIGINGMKESISIVSLIALIIIGQVVIVSMIGARKWHVEYMNCAIIIQEILLKESFNIDFKALKKKAEPYNSSFHTSRSFVLTQLTIMINIIFIGFFISFLNIGFYAYLITFLISISVVFYNQKMASKKLKKYEQAFWKNPLKNWVLVGLNNI